MHTISPLARMAPIAIVAGLAVATPARALDPSAPFLCALTHAQECIETGCSRHGLDTLNAPRFLRIDLARDHIDLPGKREPDRHTLIQSKREVAGGVMMQGMGDGHGGTRRDSGWSMFVSAESEHMILTVTRPDAAFTFFGNCTNL